METNNNSIPDKDATVQDKPDSPRVTTVTPAAHDETNAPETSVPTENITEEDAAEEASNVGQGPAVEDL